MNKARQTRQDSLNLTPQKRSDATPKFSQPTTYKAFGIVMTAMSKKDLSTLAIWSSVSSKMRLGHISSTPDGKGPSSSQESQG
jgi:hypothetical protein